MHELLLTLINKESDFELIEENSCDLTTNSYSEKDKIAEYSKGVNVEGVVPILVEALKEAISKIETLETKVAALESP